MTKEDHDEKIADLRNHSEPYVTTSDLATYWRVSRKQIYKQIEAGTLSAIRLGPRLLRIRTSEAVKFEDLAKMSPPDKEPTQPTESERESTHERKRSHHEAADHPRGKTKQRP